MADLEKKIETIANLAIIAAVLISIGLGIYTFYPRGPSLPPEMKAGEKLPQSNIDWSKKERSLLLVLQKNCKFCADSVPFYKRIAEKVSASTNVVAVMPETFEESRSYLAEAGVKVNEVVNDPGILKTIRGTPTVLLADGQGIIIGVWVGKLGTEAENEILEKISVN
jgi:hypothetical protein